MVYARKARAGESQLIQPHLCASTARKNMGCANGVPLPRPDELVAQTSQVVLFLDKTVGKGAPLTLVSKEKKLDGMMGKTTTLWSAGDNVVLSYKRTDRTMVIADADGNTVGALQYGDEAGYKSGVGRALLYGLQPPEGASGHATLMLVLLVVREGRSVQG